MTSDDYDRRYTLNEVKAAFLKTFHQSGEKWFSYFGSDEERTESTEAEWQQFLDALSAAKKS